MTFKITIILAGEARGPFAPETIQLFLAEGIILPTDQARLGADGELLSVTEALSRLPRAPEGTYSRKKKKSSTKIKRDREKKILIYGSYIFLASCFILIYIFHDFVYGFLDDVNYFLYTQCENFFG